MKDSSVWILLCSILTVLGAAVAAYAASDTDVRHIEAKSVVIEEDRIVITANAVISMKVFTPPDGDSTTTSKFMGRDAAWVKVVAENATFTVLRPGQGKKEWWEEMSVLAARALRDGKEIGRIGYYRPEVTIKRNAVHSITGVGYIYPKRDE